jgi:hypothetical protein
MAKNTGRGTPNAQAEARRQSTPSSGGPWERRNPVSGKFTEAKKTGGSFKGTRRAS